MSGAVAAHAAYNGSGTQGLATTNVVTPSGGDAPDNYQEHSVFWNQNDYIRHALYGSAIVEIPASGNGGTLVGAGNQEFSVNSDIDAIGDLFLQISFTGTSGKLKNNKTMLDIIKKIEFKVAAQTFHQLEHDDIVALNNTEMSEGAFESYFHSIAGGVAKDGKKRDGVDYELGATNANGTRTTAHKQIVAGELTSVVRVPLLTKTCSPMLSSYYNVSEGSYILAGAPTTNVRVKVYTYAVSEICETGSAFTSVELKLFGKQQVMTNAERNYFSPTVNTAGVPKKVKSSQHGELAVTPSISALGTTEVTLDLDHFSLFASHLLIALDNKDCHIKTAELKLNTSSFSGELDGSFLTGSVANALGLYNNQFYASGVGLNNNFYIFPLSSQAYGAAGVPLNRFDNVRLTLVIKNAKRTAAATVNTSASFTGSAGPTTTKVSVTCVGETTIMYKAGSATIAMY